MVFKFHRYWRKDGITHGATVTDSWTADEDYIIKRIHLQRSDGVALTASTFYWKIADRVYTREEVPGRILAPDALTSPVLDVPISKGEKLDWVFKNLEGTTIHILVTLEVWSK